MESSLNTTISSGVDAGYFQCVILLPLSIMRVQPAPRDIMRTWGTGVEAEVDIIKTYSLSILLCTPPVHDHCIEAHQIVGHYPRVWVSVRIHKESFNAKKFVALGLIIWGLIGSGVQCSDFVKYSCVSEIVTKFTLSIIKLGVVQKTFYHYYQDMMEHDPWLRHWRSPLACHTRTPVLVQRLVLLQINIPG